MLSSIVEDKISGRIFINPSLGCTMECKYCYLPEFGLSTSKISKKYEFDEVVSSLDSIYPYDQGNIFSFGCYTEPFLAANKLITLKLIDYLIAKNEKIQVATKCYLNKREITRLSGYKRIQFNISMPLPALASKYEIGAPTPKKRIEFLEDLIDNGLHANLYLKPFLHEFSEKDLNVILEMLKYRKVPIILGKLFSKNAKGIKAPFPSGDLNEVVNDCRYDDLFSQLRRLTMVYENSCDAMKGMV